MVPPNDEQKEMTGTPAERFSDDLLLAYALELEPDGELEQALATDETLRERLLAMRADLGAVEDQVRAAVPAPEHSWADLSAARWHRLRPYVSIRPARAPRRHRLGLRVLAPAAAVLVAALVLGIALSQSGGVGGGSSGGGTPALKAGPEKTMSAGSAHRTPTKAPYSQKQLAADAAAYRVAVVAQAGTVTASTQEFTVVRTLKGVSSHTLKLQVEVGGALKQGSLALLFLKPVDEFGTQYGAGQDGQAVRSGVPAAVPSAVPSPSSVNGPVDGTAILGPSAGTLVPGSRLYLYQGTVAAVLKLPAGTSAGSVTLP